MNKKIIITQLAVLLLMCTANVFAQQPLQNEQLRIEVWAELDAYPGLVPSDGAAAAGSTVSTGNTANDDKQADSTTMPDAESASIAAGSTTSTDSTASTDSTVPAADSTIKSDTKKVYEYAVSRIKELAPFLMGGMINGWKFDYIPSDKVRGVKEYFITSPEREFDQKVNPIEYHQPEFLDDKLVCWLYCNRTPSQQKYYELWNSIIHPKIRGVGQAPVEDGFDGIKEACENAIKDAVREYWRGIVKNKPKEITGTVLLIHYPRIYVKSGMYTVDLDFFLETDRIVPYSSF